MQTLLFQELIKGDLPLELACEEPSTGGWGILGTLTQAALDLDGLISKFRRAAHSVHRGKTRKEAIEEFKSLAPALFEKNGEELPRPVGWVDPKAPKPLPKPNPAIAVDAGLHPPGSVHSPQVDSPRISDQTTKVEPVCLEPGVQNQQGQICPDEIAAVVLHDNSGSSVDKLSPNTEALQPFAPPSHGTLDSTTPVPAVTPKKPVMFSKEWWTPGHGIAVGAAAVAATGALVGGFFLLKKLFGRRKNKKDKMDKKERLHARSWKVETNLEDVYSRFR